MSEAKGFSREGWEAEYKKVIEGARVLAATTSPHNILHLLGEVEQILAMVRVDNHRLEWPDAALCHVRNAILEIRTATAAEPIPAAELDPVTWKRKP